VEDWKALAAWLRKIYEVDLMLCRGCGETMKSSPFITHREAIERILDHLA